MPNLQVIKAMQSLTSRGLVTTQFSWQWYYYVLTAEGVEYLREWCVTLYLRPYGISWQHSPGLTCPPRLCPPRTRRLSVPRARHRSAVEAMVRTVPRAATATTTGRRRMRLATTGHGSQVSAVVPLGSRFHAGAGLALGRWEW